jgi:hypothetical protein
MRLDVDWLFIAPVLAGGGVMVITQVLSARRPQAASLASSLSRGISVGIVFVALFVIAISAFLRASLLDVTAAMVADCIVFLCICYGYFHFLNLGETARRVRLLWELESSEGGLSYNEILDRYGAREMIDLRIGRLTNDGQIAQKNGRLYARGSSVVFMARVMVLLKRLFLGKRQVDF